MDKEAASIALVLVTVLAVFAAVQPILPSYGEPFSEIGVLGRRPPRLVTTLRAVEPGTSGGASVLGTVATAAGGLAIGLVALLLLVWLAGRGGPAARSLPGGPGPVGGGGGAREITYLTFPTFHTPTAADQTREPRRTPPATPRVQVVDLPTNTSVADVVPMASLGGGLAVPGGAGPGLP